MEFQFFRPQLYLLNYMTRTNFAPQCCSLECFSVAYFYDVPDLYINVCMYVYSDLDFDNNNGDELLLMA